MNFRGQYIPMRGGYYWAENVYFGGHLSFSSCGEAETRTFSPESNRMFRLDLIHRKQSPGYPKSMDSYPTVWKLLSYAPLVVSK